MNVMQDVVNTKKSKTQQAKCGNNYKNTGIKVLKINTLIWFNSGSLNIGLMKTDNFAYCTLNNKYARPNLASVHYIRVLVHINKIQRDATVCRYLFTAKSLYMFWVSIAPIIRST